MGADAAKTHADRLLSRLSEVEGILAAALERPARERAAFLDHACGSDFWLRDTVARALAAEEAPDPLLASGGAHRGPLWDELSAELDAHDSVVAGDRVGAYRILRIVGRGGMGVVCLAERADGVFEQSVALKILARGTDTRELRRRFAQERQILASLNHPAIARLLDGGVAPDGRPYFAMEFIEGQPVDEYCDARRLTIQERLRLAREVIAAVCYAHRSLVIHRDIKPSNILVTNDGEVKLLDFGIAKVLEGASVLQAGPPTCTEGRLMTPEYASPEQVCGAPVTTASDVYQLGLLLYQLLCGRHPHRVAERTPQALERAICEQEPVPPSAAVTGRGALENDPDPGAVADARRLSPDRLRRTLTGDLDTIVLMALRKEPQRRYASAEQLDLDIERYLAGQPVLARKDTIAYRTCKFARRHRVAVALSSALLLLAVISAWRLADERNLARSAARNASEIAAFTKELLEASDPGRTKGDEISAQELLSWGARRVAQERDTGPEVRAVIMATLGDIYRRRGMYDQAMPLLEEALALRRKYLGEDHVDVAASLNALADLKRAQGRYPEAEPLYQKALEIRERTLGEDHPDAAETLDNLGKLNSLRGRYPEAKAFFRRALRIRMATLGPDHPDVAGSLANLAAMSMQSGECDRSLRQFRRALAITERALGPDHPQVAAILPHLAFVQRAQGDWVGAEAGLRRTLAICEARLGPRHPDVFSALTNLGDHYQKVGAYREAEALYARAVATAAVALPPDHPNVAAVLNNLCALHLDQGEVAAAAPYCDRALAIREKVLGPSHPVVTLSLRNLARLRQAQGRSAEAISMQRRMLEIYRQLGNTPGGTATLCDQATTLLGLGRWAEAETTFGESLESAARTRGERAEGCLRSGVQEARVYLGFGLVRRARGDEAGALASWRQALAMLDAGPLPPMVETLDLQARILLLLGRTREAAPIVARLNGFGWRNPELTALAATSH